MTLYELVKVVLDELYEAGEQQYGDKLDATIKQRIDYLADHYKGLNKGQAPINYKDTATRFAYVFKYVAAHGDYVVQILEALHEHVKAPLFSGEHVRLSCIGGGPGSDLIGLLKYLDKSDEPVKKVTCYLLDKEQAWGDTWTEIDDTLSPKVALHPVFQPLDVTKPDTWVDQKRFLKADLFTMSYFVSEVQGLDGDGSVSKFFSMLFSEAKSGAYFLFDDNSSDIFQDFFDAQCKKAKLKLLCSWSGRIYPHYTEQANVLEKYTKKFDVNPKIQAYLGYRVLVKP